MASPASGKDNGDPVRCPSPDDEEALMEAPQMVGNAEGEPVEKHVASPVGANTM